MATEPRRSNLQEDDKLWKEYLDMAKIMDDRLMVQWTAIVDAVLVVMALFSGVLTAFIIKTSNELQPNPGDVTNQILIAIYNRTMNASLPIDLEQYLRLDNGTHRRAFHRYSLLYISLAFSILVSVMATMAKLWVVRYNREVTVLGPPYVRVKRRQEAYSGSIAWKLGGCIESLPVMTLIPFVLFGFFIHYSMSDPYLGYFVGAIQLAALTVVLTTSASASVISDSPFKSSISDTFRLLFRILPDPKLLPKLQRVVRLRTIAIVVSAIVVLIATACLVMNYNGSYIALTFYPMAAGFASLPEIEEKDTKPRLLSLPVSLFLSVTILFVILTISNAPFRPYPWFLIFYTLAGISIGVVAYVASKMYGTKPKTARAEAVAFILKSSSTRAVDWYHEAIEIAKESDNLRVLLLEHLLPSLTPLIMSISEDGCQYVTQEQKTYITCLAELVNFNPAEGAFWKNEAPLKHPILMEELREKLEKLKSVRYACLTAECPCIGIGKAARDILSKLEGHTDGFV